MLRMLYLIGIAIVNALLSDMTQAFYNPCARGTVSGNRCAEKSGNDRDPARSGCRKQPKMLGDDKQIRPLWGMSAARNQQQRNQGTDDAAQGRDHNRFA